METTVSAFSRPQRSNHEDYLFRNVPRSNILAHVTGGLKSLYDCIKLGGAHLLDANTHTDSDGCFVPERYMMLARRYCVQSCVETSGQSAVLVEARDYFHKMMPVVIKIMHTSYLAVGLKEVQTLRKMNLNDRKQISHTVHLLNSFRYEDHICLVFPLLNPSPLTRVIAAKHLHGSEILSAIRKISLHLLSALAFLRSLNIIHADIKPENILLERDGDINTVTLIDFGNVIHHTHSEVSLYYTDFELQTQPYRAPEVHLGHPFSMEVDMWSLGCVLLELLTGQLPFAGNDRADSLKKMVSALGPLPIDMCRRGKFYNEVESVVTMVQQSHKGESGALRLMSAFPYIRNYEFFSFLSGLLTYHPDKRMTPWEALQHPFMAPVICIPHFLPAGAAFHDDVIMKTDYNFKQNISANVHRMYPSTFDLLRAGTSDQLLPGRSNVAFVEPLTSASVLSQEENFPQHKYGETNDLLKESCEYSSLSRKKDIYRPKRCTLPNAVDTLKTIQSVKYGTTEELKLIPTHSDRSYNKISVLDYSPLTSNLTNQINNSSAIFKKKKPTAAVVQSKYTNKGSLLHKNASNYKPIIKSPVGCISNVPNINESGLSNYHSSFSDNFVTDEPILVKDNPKRVSYHMSQIFETGNLCEITAAPLSNLPSDMHTQMQKSYPVSSKTENIIYSLNSRETTYKENYSDTPECTNQVTQSFNGKSSVNREEIKSLIPSDQVFTQDRFSNEVPTQYCPAQSSTEYFSQTDEKCLSKVLFGQTDRVNPSSRNVMDKCHEAIGALRCSCLQSCRQYKNVCKEPSIQKIEGKIAGMEDKFCASTEKLSVYDRKGDIACTKDIVCASTDKLSLDDKEGELAGMEDKVCASTEKLSVDDRKGEIAGKKDIVCASTEKLSVDDRENDVAVETYHNYKYQHSRSSLFSEATLSNLYGDIKRGENADCSDEAELNKNDNSYKIVCDQQIKSHCQKAEATCPQSLDQEVVLLDSDDDESTNVFMEGSTLFKPVQKYALDNEQLDKSTVLSDRNSGVALSLGKELSINSSHVSPAGDEHRIGDVDMVSHDGANILNISTFCNEACKISPETVCSNNLHATFSDRNSSTFVRNVGSPANFSLDSSPDSVSRKSLSKTVKRKNSSAVVNKKSLPATVSGNSSFMQRKLRSRKDNKVVTLCMEKEQLDDRHGETEGQSEISQTLSVAIPQDQSTDSSNIFKPKLSSKLESLKKEDNKSSKHCGTCQTKTKGTKCWKEPSLRVNCSKTKNIVADSTKCRIKIENDYHKLSVKKTALLKIRTFRQTNSQTQTNRLKGSVEKKLRNFKNKKGETDRRKTDNVQPKSRPTQKRPLRTKYEKKPETLLNGLSAKQVVEERTDEIEINVCDSLNSPHVDANDVLKSRVTKHCTVLLSSADINGNFRLSAGNKLQHGLPNSKDALLKPEPPQSSLKRNLHGDLTDSYRPFRANSVKRALFVQCAEAEVQESLSSKIPVQSLETKPYLTRCGRTEGSGQSSPNSKLSGKIRKINHQFLHLLSTSVSGHNSCDPYEFKVSPGKLQPTTDNVIKARKIRTARRKRSGPHAKVFTSNNDRNNHQSVPQRSEVGIEPSIRELVEKKLRHIFQNVNSFPIREKVTSLNILPCHSLLRSEETFTSKQVKNKSLLAQNSHCTITALPSSELGKSIKTSLFTEHPGEISEDLKIIVPTDRAPSDKCKLLPTSALPASQRNVCPEVVLDISTHPLTSAKKTSPFVSLDISLQNLCTHKTVLREKAGVQNEDTEKLPEHLLSDDMKLDDSESTNYHGSTFDFVHSPYHKLVSDDCANEESYSDEEVLLLD